MFINTFQAKKRASLDSAGFIDYCRYLLVSISIKFFHYGFG